MNKDMTYKELYKICHDEAVAYANSDGWKFIQPFHKQCLIQGYLDAMLKMRWSEIDEEE